MHAIKIHLIHCHFKEKENKICIIMLNVFLGQEGKELLET